MKNKGAIIFLIIAMSFWILIDAYSLFNRYTINKSNDYDENIIDLIMSIVNILTPICFLIFAILLVKPKRTENNYH